MVKNPLTKTMAAFSTVCPSFEAQEVVPGPSKKHLAGGVPELISPSKAGSAPVTGLAGTGLVGLDGSGLASGFYFAVVTFTDPAGHNVQKQTLPILIKR